MRKILLPAFCLCFTGLSFTQTSCELHLDNVSQVTQYDLEYVGTNRIHAGIAVTDQQQTVVWYAKTSAANELLWMKSFPMAVNNPGSTAFMDLNNIVDVESCNQSDDILLSVKRIDTATFQTFIDVLKLTAEGVLVWGTQVSFAATENEFGVVQSNRMIVLDNDEIIVSNGNKNGLFVCKLSSQGAQLSSDRISIAETPIEDSGNGGWALTTAPNGGFYASLQKNSHPVLISLDSQLNVVSATEWSSLEKAVTAIRALNGDVLFGGLGVGGDFYGYISSELGATIFYDVSNGGYSGFYDFDFAMADSLPGRFFAETNQGYKLIDNASTTYTLHQISNGFSDFGTHYRLGKEHTPGTLYREATYFTRQSGPSAVPYIEEFAITAPYCVLSTSAEYPMEVIEIPANSVFQPAVYKEEYGSFTTYSPTFTARSGFVSENCFYVGTEENTLPQFELFPNPAVSGHVLHIKNSTGVETGVIVLTDLQGKIIAEYPFSEEITLPAMHSGVYFVTISESAGSHAYMQKIIVQ